jgi:hypothetical protein
MTVLVILAAETVSESSSCGEAQAQASRASMEKATN